MMFGGGMIFVWLLLCIGVYFFIKVLTDQNQQSGKADDALSVLRRRYANGDIDQKEYLKRKSDILHR